jgi:hypothetical protein
MFIIYYILYILSHIIIFIIYIFIKPRNCLSHSITYSYVCGLLTSKSPRRNFTPLIKKCYELSFVCKVGDEDKSWAPQISCVTCVRLRAGWVNMSRQMPFAVSTVWREPNPLIRLIILLNKHKTDHLQI